MEGKDGYKTCGTCGITRNFTIAPVCPICITGANVPERVKEERIKRIAHQKVCENCQKKVLPIKRQSEGGGIFSYCPDCDEKL